MSKSILSVQVQETCDLIVIINAGLEHALIYTANRAAPVIRQILKSCAGSDTMLRITLLRIISITTGIAKIFFHSEFSPFLIIRLVDKPLKRYTLAA